jgi:hypothetical protein
VIEDAIAAAADAVVMFVAEGIEPLMNRFNAPPAAEERSESQERSQESTRSEDSTEREKDSQQ